VPGRFQEVGFRSLGRLTGLQELHLDVALGSCSQVEAALTSLTGLTKLVLERLTFAVEASSAGTAAAAHTGTMRDVFELHDAGTLVEDGLHVA
jgi:hypothetical protein